MIWAAPSHDTHGYDACGRRAAFSSILHGPLPSRRRAPPLRLENTTERGRGDGGAPSDREHASGRLGPALDTRWRPVFSLKPDADEGRFDRVAAEQEFRRDGSFECDPTAWNQVCVRRDLRSEGVATTLVIEQLRVRRVLGVPLPPIDIGKERASAD